MTRNVSTDTNLLPGYHRFLHSFTPPSTAITVKPTRLVRPSQMSPNAPQRSVENRSLEFTLGRRTLFTSLCAWNKKMNLFHGVPEDAPALNMCVHVCAGHPSENLKSLCLSELQHWALLVYLEQKVKNCIPFYRRTWARITVFKSRTVVLRCVYTHTHAHSHWSEGMSISVSIDAVLPLSLCTENKWKFL